MKIYKLSENISYMVEHENKVYLVIRFHRIDLNKIIYDVTLDGVEVKDLELKKYLINEVEKYGSK